MLKNPILPLFLNAESKISFIAMLGKTTKDVRRELLPVQTCVSEIKILTFGFPIVLISSVFALLLMADGNIVGAVKSTSLGLTLAPCILIPNQTRVSLPPPVEGINVEKV